MTRVLRTATDVKKLRQELIKKQNNLDGILYTSLDGRLPALDHNHSNQKVRAVLSTEMNRYLGLLEQGYARYLKWWLKDYDLPGVLRVSADYLEYHQTDRTNIWHPDWIKKACTKFNKLKAHDQLICLKTLGLKEYNPNLEGRKKAFKKYCQSKALPEEVFKLLQEKENK